MQKTKHRYHNGGGKEKAAEYYIANKEVMTEDKNNKLKEYQKNRQEAKKQK